MDSYDQLLKQALEKAPKSAQTGGSRFEIPKVKGHIQGNKTIVTNFQSIAQTLRREPNHLLKYLLRELAAPGEISGPRLILNRKISSALINQKIEKYALDFVICKECKKPDTKVEKEGRYLMLKCTACGAKHPINTRI
tara:strand:+ start:146 stop:559 length:414 start_codon:yes stop_codon:yes gene_type:complete